MNAYDQVPYINSPYAQTHPSRMFVMGRLAGIQPAAVEGCRVLEIGASEGENLVGMAMVLPLAEFVGIELAEVPVARGRETIADLGLKNVRLEQMNLLDVDEGFGQFDYVIAHGLYAWTPAIVRDKILAIARANLDPQGIAFVSYNTHPAGHTRRMMREMMLYHIGGEENPARKLEKGRELLRILAMERTDPDSLETAVAAHARELLEKTDSALYHDELGSIYDPVHFHEFAANASRHGLQYMGEANLQDALRHRLSPEALEAVRTMAGGDRIAEQQYLDFARTRRFRQTLLCQKENRLSEGSAEASVEGCYAACSNEEVEDGVFVNVQGTRMTTTHPVVKEYLRRLIQLWPGSEQLSPELAGPALELYRVGMIELRGFPGVAQKAGDRPVASAFARYQAARGDARVTTLGHRSIELNDAAGRRFLGLLDGTRDREQLAIEMDRSREEIDASLKGLEKHELLAG
jgi:hypothetical protein